MSRSDGPTVQTRTILTGGTVGFGAFVFGYLVTYLWQAETVAERLRGFNVLAQLFGSDPVPAWKGVAWLFYNAHFVATHVPALGGARTVNFLAESEQAGIVLLYALPPLLLLLAGLFTVLVAGATTSKRGALAGASTMPGYLVPAIVVASLSEYSVGDATVGPVLVTAMLLAGVTYPLVFGTLGGLAGTLLASGADDGN
jgi:hypothetical protein